MINYVPQLMYNIRLFCGTQCSAASSCPKPELRQARTNIFRTTDETDTAYVVSELPTARKPWLYLFSRLRSNRHAAQSFCENQNSVQNQDQDHDITLDFNNRPTFHPWKTPTKFCLDPVRFGDVPRRFEVKTAFVLRQWWCCYWKIVSQLHHV